MPAKTLFKRTSGLSWDADADSINAPPGSLLRADNATPDETGAVALRQGSSLLHTLTGAPSIHSLWTAALAGTTYRFFGANNGLFRDGVDFGVTFDGSGDIPMGDDAYQAFFARGTVKKKFDGTTLNQWPIAAPALAPTLSAATSVTTTVAHFDTALDTPDFVINEGTGSYVTGYDGTSSGALKLAPNATTGRASASKVFASDQNFLIIGGSTGGDTDLFDVYVWLEDPRRVDTVTFMFGLNTGTDPYRDDYYYFDFRIRDRDTVELKESAPASSTSYSTAAARAPTVLTPADVVSVKTPQEVNEVLQRIGISNFAGPVSRQRMDSSEASPAWTHFSVTRGQFKRIGGTAGRDWQTVRGFKVVYSCVPGASVAAQFDSAVIYGGGARSLTGKYTVGYRFVRDTGTYIEKSPLSPVSSEITLTQQALRVTIPAAAISAADPQVNGIWIYVFGGFLDTYYRFAITGMTGGPTIRLDDFPRRESSVDMDTANERGVVNATEFAFPGSAVDPTLTVDILKSELEALQENEALEPGAVGPPDNIVAIAGPWASRMFVVTADGYVYPSSQDSPSNFSVYHVKDLRRWGDPLWAVRTVGGIVIGMTKDVIRLNGSGDETPDHVVIDLQPEALGIGNPPADSSVFTDGHSVVYRAVDGLVTLSGSSLTPVSQDKTVLLWRGKDRHGVQALDTTTGRFRLAVDNHILYMIAPEGTSATTASSAIWRYANGSWARTLYGVSFASIYREPKGALIAGASDGTVWMIETGTQDNSADIQASVLTAVEDGGSPLSRKDPFDIQIHSDTGGVSGLLEVYLDGAASPNASYHFSSNGPGIYRIDASELPAFIRAQVRISGAFSTFVLQSFGLTYRDRPQQMMAVDTGYLQAPDNRDLCWFAEAEVSVISPVALTLTPIMDDVAKASYSVPVTANKHSIVRVPLIRGLKGRRPRFLLKTTNPNGSGHVGFELYFMRFRLRGSGNWTDKVITYDAQGA